MQLRKPQQLRIAAVFTLAVLSAFVFWIRGPRRAIADSHDLATVYAAARCWSKHENPYALTAIDREYLLAHGGPRQRPNPGMASIYPPTAFPVIAALAHLDWSAARRAWLFTSVLLFLASVRSLLRTLRIENRIGALALLSSMLLFSPVHSGLYSGNPSVLCISLVVIAMCGPGPRRNDFIAGLLLGVSCCLKPHLALPFLLFQTWRRKWRLAVASAVVIAAIGSIALCNLAATPGWWSDWMSNLHVSSLPGNNMDPTKADPDAHLLINLQTVIGLLTTNQAVCNLATYLLAAGLSFCVLMASGRSGEEWAQISFLSALVLLATYHRYYDLQLLMLAAKTFMEVFCSRERARMTMALLFTLLALPLQAIAGKFLHTPGPDSGAAAVSIALIVFRNQPICISVLAILFARIAARRHRASAPEAAEITRPGCRLPAMA